MGEKYVQEFGPKNLTCLQLVGTWVKNISGIWSQIYDMSSASGYMGEKYFQEVGPIFVDMSSVSGYMGAICLRNLVPDF